MVIADNCSKIIDVIFDDSIPHGSVTLIFGAILFSFQIYCDFSGYSDIAIGTSKLFGFNLKKNFAFPYFSRDVGEFWRRWHISLSTWFRDYLYIPLGGSSGKMNVKIRNTFIVFLVSGFWHGANWTYIIWGGLNAIYFLPLLILGKNRKNLDNIGDGNFLNTFKEIFYMIWTFSLITTSWVFFRSKSLSQAYSYLSNMFNLSNFKHNLIELHEKITFDWGYHIVFLIIVFLIVEWLGRRNEFALEKMFNIKSKFSRVVIYTIILFTTGCFMVVEDISFIYFQF